MDTLISRVNLLAMLKDALQWNNAVLEKAKKEVKWYHQAPFSRKAVLVGRIEWQLSLLVNLLKQLIITEADKVNLDWFMTDLVYNKKTYAQMLEGK